METKTGKRIVSKEAYAQAQADRAFMGIIGLGLWISAFCVGLLTVGCFIALLINLSEASFEAVGACLVAVLLFGLISGACGRMGNQIMQTMNAIDPGVPLTRANSGDIPAPDSLVRASSEPVQAQEAVLLRAATEEQETPPEQLLRASVPCAVTRSGRAG